MSSSVKQSLTPIVPKNNRKQYEIVVCSNGCRILLIADPKTEFGTFALNTGVGSYCEPIPRLVALLQSILLNVEPSSDVPSLATFIETSEGSGGSIVHNDIGIISFQCPHEIFQDAVHMFLRFLCSPRFDLNSIEKEILFIDSLVTAEKNNEDCLLEDIIRSQMNPSHPASQPKTRVTPVFDIAKDKLCDLCRNFFEKEYSSNRMSIAIQSKGMIEQLKSWLIPLAENIPNHNLDFATFSPSNPLEGYSQNKFYQIIPQKDYNALVLEWATPDLTKEYKADPSGYIDSLLQYGHSKGLLDYLKKREFAYNVSLSVPLSIRGTHISTIRVLLTEKGVEEYMKVLEAIFKYLGLIKRMGCEKWRMTEYSIRSEIEFDLEERSSPLNEVHTHSLTYRSYCCEQM
ncbi:hypothetical protein ACOME3_001570 [Neoechinorhynchus agilis]